MRILFQGDSITDAGRSREKEYKLGEGYARLVEAALGYAYPAKHEFINRGVSGNRVTDVYARIRNDIINLKPDFMSILIGVNDVWHGVNNDNGVDADKYFKIYSMLIEEIKAALPNIKIMILEPFVLRGEATSARWEEFRSGVEKRAEMAKKIAQTYDLPFVPLQKGFDELEKLAPAEYWLRDGVHPTAKGHEYIKQEWIKMFETL